MKLQNTSATDCLEFLIVDAHPSTSSTLVKAASNWGNASRVRLAASVDQARAELKSRPADVVFISLQINDNAGLALVQSVHNDFPNSRIIALSRSAKTAPDQSSAIYAAGASDILNAPFRAVDIHRSLTAVFSRNAQIEKLTRRNRRLRQVCKQLNKARHEIRSQVDLLCNDLVRAYQEMAQQLNITQTTVDYCQAVGNEIEVEGILRKTMEWVLQKLGPINAAVYLSDADHRFALGAYLNLDTEAEADLIHAIGETIIRQTDGGAHALSVDDDNAIDELFGEHGQRLKGRAWLSAACYTATAQNRECLAVLVLFRGQQTSAGPFDQSVRSMIEAVAPILGEKIEQALELYHRMHPDEEEE